MKHHYLFLLLLYSFSASAQIQSEYIPAVVEGATWVHYVNVDGFRGHHTYTITGDSTVNGTTYKRVYRTPITLNTPWPTTGDAWTATGASVLYGLVLEDTLTRRVYGRITRHRYDQTDALFTPDTLLYDFSIQYGDTITGYYYNAWYRPEDYCVADDIQHNLFFGKVRRGYNTCENRTIYEGIGHNEYGIFNDVRLWFIDVEAYGLIGHCIGNECSLETLSSLRELPLLDLSLYPNPADQRITVTGLDRLGGEISLTLHSADGQILQRRTVRAATGQTVIGLATLPAGLYFLEATGRDARAVSRVVKR